MCHLGYFWQRFTEYLPTGDISDGSDLSLIPSVLVVIALGCHDRERGLIPAWGINDQERKKEVRVLIIGFPLWLIQ